MREVKIETFVSEPLSTLDLVSSGSEQVLVRRQQQRSVVIVALTDYSSLVESVHLLESPKNAARVLRSIARLEDGDRQRAEQRTPVHGRVTGPST